MSNKPENSGGNGEPPADDAGMPEPKGKRQFGALRGQFAIGREFFEPLPPDELERWRQ